MRPEEEAYRPGMDVAADERVPEVLPNGRGITQPAQQQFRPCRVDERRQPITRHEPVEVAVATLEQLVGIPAIGPTLSSEGERDSGVLQLSGAPRGVNA